MARYTLHYETFIPAPLTNVWNFFATPVNLPLLTPSYMRFRITSVQLPATVFEGQIITYKVSPLLTIPMNWASQIIEVHSHKAFTDVQLKGPFRFWQHQHLFEPDKLGVRMTDIVQYEPPLMYLGDLANRLFIAKQLESLFVYRRMKIQELFPGQS